MRRIIRRLNSCARIIVILALSISFLSISAQERKKLEERKSRTKNEIDYTNNLLIQTRESRRGTSQRVRILKKRIQLRNDIIKTINRENELIDEEIEQKNILIAEMGKDFAKIREKYAELVIHAYWNRSKKERVMFILSSEDFNQAFRRMKYYQLYAVHRREQAAMIKKMQIKIIDEIEQLEEIKMEKKALVLEKRNENHNLEKEKQRKNIMISELMRKEKNLKKEMEEKKRIAEKLEKEIAAIIAEEARKGRSRNMYDQLTPEEKLISDNFRGNKGKLPWPVERGIITGKYGVHPHPVLKQITVDNDGVDIATVRGAKARALFEGEVRKVFAILGKKYAVIIRHGDFLTVYQNLVGLKVKQGDQVKAKQILGTVYTEEETNNTILHIEIWKERTIQNPEDWLSRNS